LLLFVAGAALSVWFFTLERVRNHARERAELERDANRITMDLRAKLELPIEVLQTIAGYFDASEAVSRAEFRVFVRAALERHRGIRALEWIPIVPAAKRAEYEARARSDGLSDFEFKEEGPSLSLVTARARPEYLPVYYMEPPDATALGFDVGANPARRAPVDRAREKGTAVASERMRLVEDAPSVYSVAVFYAVKKPGTDAAGATLLGYTAEVFRVRSLVLPVFAAAMREGNGVVLLDLAAPPELRLLFESSAGLHADSSSTTAMAHTTTFPFADRSWSLRVIAGPSRQAKLNAWPWAWLLFGLLISALLALMLSAFMQIYQLRREVHAALRLGQYTLVEKLGEGGMGVVYRARHAMLRRATAIKLLPPGKRSTEDITRFEREVQLTSQLAHPNTISVYDYGRTADGVFYYAMEFIDGIALEDLVANEGPLPASRVVHILMQVCGALDEAHARGIIHRDIKPANLMLTERGGIPDFVKVLDFGLVKEILSDVPIGQSRGTPLLGTPLYISPEAILSGAVDARSDLYALGAVAYYLVTGETVFDGESLVEVCVQHLSKAPIPPSLRTTAPVPASLEALILRCLAKVPDDRPASATLLRKELLLIQAEVGAFDEQSAHAWWQERGRALVADLSAKRHVGLQGEDGRLTAAADSKRGAETPRWQQHR
jgi:serine/threonine-protein kinase